MTRTLQSELEESDFLIDLNHTLLFRRWHAWLQMPVGYCWRIRRGKGVAYHAREIYLSLRGLFGGLES